MDYTVLYILAICAVTAGLIYLISFLEKRSVINKEQMNLVSVILGLGIEILKDLKIKDPLIIKISEIVKDSVDLAVNQLQEGVDARELAEEYVIKECDRLQIELTAARLGIIKELIVVLLLNRYCVNNPLP